jgi:hypothetical protein
MRLTRPTVLAAALAASSAAGAPFLAAIGAAPAADPALAETVADVDTMRLVLVKALSASVRDYVKERADELRPDQREEAKEPAPPGVDPAGQDLQALAHLLGRSGDLGSLYGLTSAIEMNVTSETRGFLARGLGAIYTTEVSVPVRRRDAAAGAEGERDLWEDALDERGGRRDVFFGDAAAWQGGGRVVLDEAAIDRVVRAAIDAIGRYGSRIDGLADDDVIVVAMHFRGHGFAEMLGESIRGWLGAGTLRETRVVELPLAEIRRYAAGAYDLDKLAQRAVVTAYGTGSASVSGGAR